MSIHPRKLHEVYSSFEIPKPFILAYSQSLVKKSEESTSSSDHPPSTADPLDEYFKNNVDVHDCDFDVNLKQLEAVVSQQDAFQAKL